MKFLAKCFLFMTLFSMTFASKPSIVFIHLGQEPPEYLSTALSQARLFNSDCPIYLILNKSAFKNCAKDLKKNKIKIVFYENLKQSSEHSSFLRHSTLDSSFREGFWKFASERFFCLDEFMNQYKIDHIFHLESDNMLYLDIQEVFSNFSSCYSGIAATFDNDQRCIPGMIYIASPKAIKKLVQYMVMVADKGLSDMEVIGQFREISSPDVIDSLPVIPSSYREHYPLISLRGKSTRAPEIYSNHFETLNCLFDAACIGQFVGGIDPRNAVSAPGFINESSLYNPKNFDFIWLIDAKGRKVPHIGMNNQLFPLANLHIHSKNLKKFYSYPNQQNRNSSYPFISGDTFRAFADFVYDETNRMFFPEYVRKGSVIFVKTDFVKEFFQRYHEKIRNPYVLITHNSDREITEEYLPFFQDGKILAWFAQNVMSVHPKLHPLPIGIANQYWRHGSIQEIKKILTIKAQLPKKYFLYMNFEQLTYPERGYVKQIFKTKSFVHQEKNKQYREYLSDLARSKFVLSPRGNGIDCHRIWETLFMGSYPVVKTSMIDSLFEDLPVLIVNDWKEVTQDLLDKKFLEFTSKEFRLEKLFSDYWFNQILFYKRQEKTL